MLQRKHGLSKALLELSVRNAVGVVRLCPWIRWIALHIWSVGVSLFRERTYCVQVSTFLQGAARKRCRIFVLYCWNGGGPFAARQRC